MTQFENLVIEKLGSIDKRLDRIEERLDKNESDIASLKNGQLEMRRKMKEMDYKLTKTYELALEAWGAGSRKQKITDRILVELEEKRLQKRLQKGKKGFNSIFLLNIAQSWIIM